MTLLRADSALKKDLEIDFTIEAAGEPGYYLIDGKKVNIGETIDLPFQSIKVIGEDANGNLQIVHSDFTGDNVYTYNIYDDLSMSRLRDYQFIYEDQIDSLTQKIDKLSGTASTDDVSRLESQLQNYKDELAAVETKIDTFDLRTRINELKQELNSEEISGDYIERSFLLNTIEELENEVMKKEAENANRNNDSQNWQEEWSDAFGDEIPDPSANTDNGLTSLPPTDTLPLTTVINYEPGEEIVNAYTFEKIKNVPDNDEQVLYVPKIDESNSSNFSTFISEWTANKTNISNLSEECKTILETAKEPFNKKERVDDLINLNDTLKDIDAKISSKTQDNVSADIAQYNADLLSAKERVRQHLLEEKANSLNNTVFDTKTFFGSDGVVTGEEKVDGWYTVETRLVSNESNDDSSDDSPKLNKYEKIYRYAFVIQKYTELEQYFKKAENFTNKTLIPYQIDKIKDM